MKEIPLTKGKVALVDDEDYEWLMAMGKWSFSTSGYAVRNASYRLLNGKVVQKYMSMHRVITNAPNGMVVDHGDHHKLNNQRSNLRVCTRSQNKMNVKCQANNTSGFKGVTWNKKLQKWHAHTQINGKSMHLGFFIDKIEAARAYNDMAIQYHREFACLNEIPV